MVMIWESFIAPWITTAWHSMKGGATVLLSLTASKMSGATLIYYANRLWTLGVFIVVHAAPLGSG